jgi:hypothetical protein
MSSPRMKLSRRLVSALSLPLLASGQSLNSDLGAGVALAMLSSFTVQSFTVQCAQAQFTNSQAKTVVIPAGTTFEGRMDSTVSSKHSHQGDRFNVILSSPVLANGMDVVIPAGSQVVGEVVEALPAGGQPHDKGQKPNGKLRTQLTALRTPDGMTYPLVGSFIGETTGKGQQSRQVQGLGSGVAYVGAQSNFNAVYPVNRQQGGNNRGPQLVTKKQMMDDPLYGDPDRNQNQNGQQAKIRSLVKDHREIYIHEGSPMSVRLDAPLRMAIVPVGGMSTNTFSDQGQSSAPTQARPNFTRARSSIAPPPTASAPQMPQQQAPAAQAAAPVVPARDPSVPSFLDPVPGQRPPTAAPQWSTPAASQASPQSFNSQGGGQGLGQSVQGRAPQAPPANFGSSSMSPAEQAASIPQSNPFSSAGAGGFKAAPQSPPQSFNTFSAPAAQAPQAQSLNGNGIGFSAPPAQAAPAQAPAAQSLFGDPTGSKTSVPPSNAAPAAAASLNAFSPPAPPPSGQSLGNFINSLAPVVSTPAAAVPAAEAAGSLAAPAPPAIAGGAASTSSPPAAPATASSTAAPAAAAPLPNATPASLSPQSVDSFINSLSKPATAAPAEAAPAAPAVAPSFAAPAQASQAPAAPAAQAAPATFAPPRTVQTPAAPRTAPGDNF